MLYLKRFLRGIAILGIIVAIVGIIFGVAALVVAVFGEYWFLALLIGIFCYLVGWSWEI